eukprot:9478116-Pyramimonas_sp.AAC.1
MERSSPEQNNGTMYTVGLDWRRHARGHKTLLRAALPQEFRRHGPLKTGHKGTLDLPGST